MFLHIPLPKASHGQAQSQWDRDIYSTPIGEREKYLLSNNLTYHCLANGGFLDQSLRKDGHMVFVFVQLT